jgi:hypothetical protein
MLNENDVLNILSPKIEVIKKANGKPYSFGFAYDKAMALKKRLMPHYNPEYFPRELFLNRAPNQTQKEYDYMKENHKGITYVVWDRFKTSLRRIWNDANWSVTSWGEVDQVYIDAGYEPKDYFENEYPEFISLENFYKTVLTDYKEKDPNAVLVHKPEYLPVIETEEGFRVDDSQMINPIAYIFPCERVVEFTNDYFIGISDVKSMVSHGNSEKEEGIIFEVYDKENIWLVRQYGRKIDYTFTVELYWSHNLGYLPCKMLRAEPEYIDGRVIYKSHFMPAVEPLDLCLLDSANLLIAKNRHVFPKFWEYQTDCDNVHDVHGACSGGYHYSASGDKIKCGACNGTGKRSMSPFGTYIVPLPDRTNPDVGNATLPPAGYIQPEIQTPEFLDKQIDKNLNRGLSILNLHISNEDVQGGDTALGKQIDREEMFSFLLNISSQIFHLFEFSLKTIQKMRYGVDAIEPTVTYPKNFSIRNESDLTKEISDAKAGGMPDIGIRQLIIEYYNTRFSVSDEASKVIELVFYSDRLVTLSNQEIQVKLASGSIAKWEDILHTSISQFIHLALTENESFLELSIEEKYTKLVEMAKQKEAEITPKMINTDSILTNANA